VYILLGTVDGERMDDQLRELVALGKEHFQRGDYSLAAGHLEQAAWTTSIGIISRGFTPDRSTSESDHPSAQ